ncbi:MAG: hypothetical protein JOZ41_21010 [Chloroflexi bacterium]|nr:hypothetical protein [Chloroflexota bacterium]
MSRAEEEVRALGAGFVHAFDRYGAYAVSWAPTVLVRNGVLNPAAADENPSIRMYQDQGATNLQRNTRLSVMRAG